MTTDASRRPAATSTASGRGRGRTKAPARPADLDLSRIAAAALAVADATDVEGFTMRAVADVLGVSAMALYHHVPDKAGLVKLVSEAVITECPLPEPTGDWREDLWQMASWMRDRTLRHPTAGKLRQRYRVWTPAVFPVTERWMNVWQQSGLPLEQAVTGAISSSMAVTGMVAEEAVFAELDLPDLDDLVMLPNARMAFSAKRDFGEDFELLVRSLIDGLHGRLSQASPPGADA
jgi:AcrR family transcriptional regulator